MNYKETVDYLFSVTPCFQREGGKAYKPGLERMIRMCDAIGNPHRGLRAIHVGGTNGKGSTTSLLAAILTAAGYKVGLFTSPHLVDFRERIRVNGEMITEQEVVTFVEETRPLIKDIAPSFFEYTTLMAFDHFRRHQVDYAIIEVGLGGRLDSTNVISPEISVITNISLDHTQFLGDTIEKIAFEKAGIIKDHTPIVIGRAEGEVRQVFEHVASELSAPIFFSQESHTVLRTADTLLGLRLETSDYGDIETPLCGVAQIENTQTVLTALRVLTDMGMVFPLTPELVARGFKEVYHLSGLRGRWETLRQAPLLVCDTAHNPAGILIVAEQLKQIACKNLYVVLGMSADKDIDRNLSLLPKNASYVFSSTKSERTIDAETLRERAERIGLSGKTSPSVEDAVSELLALCDEDDAIFVGGSNFIVAELLRMGDFSIENNNK